MAPEDLPCIAFVDLVTDYLEGATDEAGRARIDHHLATCPYCAVFLTQIEDVIALVGAADDGASRPDRYQQLLSAFRASQQDP